LQESGVSRAFVKEDDQRNAGDELPERAQSPHPNYVTAQGLADLKQEVEALLAQRQTAMQGSDALAAEGERIRIDRNLRYANSRIACAILVEPANQPADAVAFGATVRVREPDGEERVFTIVGEDEADAGRGKASWVSPLARALQGAQVGDSVTWKRPSGDLDIEVISIEYLGA
jgi:transcription elongation GreA/GreB family factor